MNHKTQQNTSLSFAHARRTWKVMTLKSVQWKRGHIINIHHHHLFMCETWRLLRIFVSLHTHTRTFSVSLYDLLIYYHWFSTSPRESPINYFNVLCDSIVCEPCCKCVKKERAGTRVGMWWDVNVNVWHLFYDYFIIIAQVREPFSLSHFSIIPLASRSLYLSSRKQSSLCEWVKASLQRDPQREKSCKV
jgi:hypothetical protein